MCGIAGWVSYSSDLRTQEDVIKTMTETMALRGPDAGGMWIDRHVGLGHRRLAIIDLSGGVQPMQAEAEGQTIASLIYTGEVYNFVELRAELEQLGHRFKTRSDTEVVLHGYLQWGDKVAERLNGMFAFVIWDVRTEELLLIRDRMGVKPLYYYPTTDGVLFGSEPKAILAHPTVQPRVNKDGLREILVLAKNPESTIYTGMFEVRPGQVVRVNREGLTKRRYWMLTAREHEDDLPRTIKTVAELLEDIVRRQVVADVPLCSLLSGGLDSSTVTAMAHHTLAAQNGGGGIRSFSVDFANHGADFVASDFHKSSDTPFVRDFVAHIGCNHTEVILDSRELANPDLNHAVLQATDFPVSVSGDMFSSLYRLFQAIRANTTVALSGESADEVFGGYPWFHDPKAVAKATFPWLATTSGTSDTQVLDPGLLEWLDLPAFLADSYAQAISEAPVLKGEDATERRMREISYLHLTRFVQFLLDRKDRMSMAVGLEVRVPFCDHRLVDYVFNIPWHMKTFDGREKSILRAAARELLPDSIIERQKSPYPSTQDPAYEKAVRDDVTAIVEDKSHPATPLLNPKAIKNLLKQPLGKTSSLPDRAGLERTRSISAWVKDYGVMLDV